MAKKTKLQIDFEADVSKFDEGIKKANAEIYSMRKELKLNATELKNNSNSIELVSQKQSILAKESEASKDKITALESKLNKAKETFGENSREVHNLQNQLTDAKTQFAAIQNEIQDTDKRLNELSNELENNSNELKDVDDNADKAGKQLSDLADDTKKSSDGFTIGKGVIANFVSNGLTALVNKCKEGIQWIAGLADETREFRQDMNTLTTAFDAANFSNETAQNTWKNLYAIFGEDDRAVEAANNISRMAENEEDLNEWVEITTGIWGTYQDALPVESLAEAAGETAKTAKVTGTLADALNWNSEAAQMFSQYMSEDVITAEDAFNVALSKCSDEQERQQLITETLTTLYGDAAEKYNETASSIIEANKATADLTTAQADLGATIEPLSNQFKIGFAGVLSGFNELLQGQQIGTEKMLEGITHIFDTITSISNNVLPGVLDSLLGGIVAMLPQLGTIAVTLIVTLVNSFLTQIPNVLSAGMEIVVALISGISSVVPQLLPLISTIIGEIISTLKTGFPDLILAAVDLFMSIVNAIPVVIPMLLEILPTVIDEILFCLHWAVVPILEAAIDAFSAIIEAIPMILPALISAVPLIINSLLSTLFSAQEELIVVATDVFMAIVDAIPIIIPLLQNMIPNVITAVIDFLGMSIPTILDGAVRAFIAIVEAIPVMLPSLITMLPKIITSILDALITGAPMILNGALNAFYSIVEAIPTVAVSLLSAGKNLVSSFLDCFQSIPETIGNLFEGLKSKIKVPKINVTYSTDGTLGKVAEAIGLPGFPKLNVTWNKDGHFFTGKTLEVRGYAEAGDSEYALPLNKKTLDPLAAGIVNHMDSSTDLSEVTGYIREVYNEIRIGNLTIEDKFIDAVANRLKLMLDNREVGRVVRSF